MAEPCTPQELLDEAKCLGLACIPPGQQWQVALALLCIISQNGGGGDGTVTSVDVSGGSTGLTTTGGPVTTAGTITLAGTLGIANGGTGQITAPLAVDALGGAASTGTGGLVRITDPALLGNPTVPTQAPGNNSTRVSSTAFVTSAVAAGAITTPVSIANGGTGQATAALAVDALGGAGSTGTGGLVRTSGPTLTGVPAAPTASPGTNTTQLATTAFVTAAVATPAPPSIETLTDAATVTPDSTKAGGYLATLSQTTTIANPTGSPSNFQTYRLRIKSTTSRALSFGNQFRGSNVTALPVATSGGSLTDYYGFTWDAQSSTWAMLAVSTGFAS